MGLEVVFVCAFLCMLQFHAGKSECYKLQLRVPGMAINGQQQNMQFNPNCPYPMARNGNNICNTCKGTLCNNNCNSNNAISFQPSGKNLVVSVPSDKSPSGRLTITIDASPSPTKKAAPDVPSADNGETSKQKVDVFVKLIPKVKNASTSTSGNSSATSGKSNAKLAANTDGIINIPGTNEAVDVSVIVNDHNTGQTPKMILVSDITADNGNGEVSKTDTKAVINKTPSDDVSHTNSSPDTPSPTPAPSDSSDSPVTGTKPAQSTPDGSQPAAPADTSSPGDTKSPEPKNADSGSPPPSNGNPSASSAAASGAVADDKSAAASSTSGAAAESG